MKNILLFLFITVSSVMFSQITYIPDANFEQALIDLGIDSDGMVNGQVLTSDIDTVQVLNVRYKNIYDLTGIEDFAMLKDLNLTGNHIETLDTSGNSQLERLNSSATPIESLNITENLALKELILGAVHRLDHVDLSGNINLEALNLLDCWLHGLDISHNINLKRLEMDLNWISEIDLSNNTKLEYLDVDNSSLERLDVSHNIELKELYCGNSGGTASQDISHIDLSNNVNLELFQAENLFELEYFNAKNGNNDILQVVLTCFTDLGPCLLPRLDCVEVDNADLANNGESPYDTWYIEADFFYSEDCTLGIPEFSQNEFIISENPVLEELILFSSEPVGNASLAIYSMQGKLLLNQNLNLESQTSLDVSHLAAGIYVLQIIEDSTGITTKRFVKK